MNFIDEIYAFIATDKGDEGIISVELENTHFPLIAADKERLESLIPVARNIAKSSGRKVKLVKFGVREFVKDIE